MATQLSTPMPTQAGFLTWVRDIMGVPVQWLPDDSLAIGYAYQASLATVNLAFRCVPGPIYMLMVYNLGGHFLAAWAPDVPTPPCFVTVDNICYGYFQWLRKSSGMTGFVTGLVNASSDEGSSVSLTVPKQFENLTIGQLQLTTTVWGRTYLGWAQDYGTNWGLS